MECFFARWPRAHRLFVRVFKLVSWIVEVVLLADVDVTCWKLYWTLHFIVAMKTVLLWILLRLGIAWQASKTSLPTSENTCCHFAHLVGLLYIFQPADCQGNLTACQRFGGDGEREEQARLKGRHEAPILILFPLPVLTLSSVRSVSNKLDELALRDENDWEFR